MTRGVMKLPEPLRTQAIAEFMAAVHWWQVTRSDDWLTVAAEWAEPWHGTWTGYGYHHCRCRYCRWVPAEYHRRRRAVSQA